MQLQVKDQEYQGYTSNFKDIHFTNVTFNNIYLAFSTLDNVTFTNCNFMWVNFQNCVYTDVIFDNCSFWYVDFTNTVLQGATYIKDSILSYCDFSLVKYLQPYISQTFQGVVFNKTQGIEYNVHLIKVLNKQDKVFLGEGHYLTGFLSLTHIIDTHSWLLSQFFQGSTFEILNFLDENPNLKRLLVEQNIYVYILRYSQLHINKKNFQGG